MINQGGEYPIGPDWAKIRQASEVVSNLKKRVTAENRGSVFLFGQKHPHEDEWSLEEGTLGSVFKLLGVDVKNPILNKTKTIGGEEGENKIEISYSYLRINEEYKKEYEDLAQNMVIVVETHPTREGKSEYRVKAEYGKDIKAKYEEEASRQQ